MLCQLALEAMDKMQKKESKKPSWGNGSQGGLLACVRPRSAPSPRPTAFLTASGALPRDTPLDVRLPAWSPVLAILFLP